MPHQVSEGDWFGVPLRTGGFGAGIVARANPNGVLLGYFFGPVRSKPPTLADVSAYRSEDAVLIAKFGDLGLRRGTWPVVGRLASWDREEWPMPVFHRFEELTGRYWLVAYDPDDPNSVPRERLTDRATAKHHPADGMAGAGFMEKKLATLLTSASRDVPQH